jgi:hypothetical protein
VSDKERTSQKVVRTARIAFRFILFGIGGFFVTLYSSLAVFAGPNPKGEWFSFSLLALFLVPEGALMMLFGAGAWERRWYALVFLSFSLGIALLRFFPATDKGNGVLLTITPPILAYLFVRRYYRHSEGK